MLFINFPSVSINIHVSYESYTVPEKEVHVQLMALQFYLLFYGLNRDAIKQYSQMFFLNVFDPYHLYY